jgi:hypothetical protein
VTGSKSSPHAPWEDDDLSRSYIFSFGESRHSLREGAHFRGAKGDKSTAYGFGRCKGAKNFFSVAELGLGVIRETRIMAAVAARNMKVTGIRS